ncbi:MAG: polysaccharide pyruvyl transferase family protein [Pseudomonadota bacterium]
MIPYYWKSPAGNFGDDLNLWLWDALLPGFRDWEHAHWLMGVGTVLSASMPAPASYMVVGSGIGYGAFPDNRAGWDIRCVRGPRTARALGLAPEAGIIDPAALITRLDMITPTPGSGRDVYIPHWDSDMKSDYDWPDICARAGIDYLSPRRDAKEVIGAIAGASRVITESMHGAILADAYRVPWCGVSLDANFNQFKWHDWGDSIGLDFEITPLPQQMQSLRRKLRQMRGKSEPVNHVRATSHAPDDAPKAAAPHPHARKPHSPLVKAAHKLQAALTVRKLKAVQKERFYLSDETQLNAQLDRLEDTLRLIRQDFS